MRFRNHTITDPGISFLIKWRPIFSIKPNIDNRLSFDLFILYVKLLQKQVVDDNKSDLTITFQFGLIEEIVKFDAWISLKIVTCKFTWRIVWNKEVFIGELTGFFIAINGVATGTISPFKISTLNHKSWNDSVKFGANITVSRQSQAKCPEVLCCPWHSFVKEFK